MAETIYEYAKTTAPDLSEIAPAIAASTMTQQGKDDYVASTWKKVSDTLYCKFLDALVTDDKTKLDAIIAALPDEPSVFYQIDDVPMPINSWERIGANMPQKGVTGVMLSYRFDPDTMNECWQTIEIPEGWDQKSDMRLVIWAQNDEVQTGVKGARMGVEYATQGAGDRYNNGVTTHTTAGAVKVLDTDLAEKTFFQIQITIDHDDADNPLVGKGQMMMRLFRDAAHEGDTMTGFLNVSYTQLKFRRDRLGAPEAG